MVYKDLGVQVDNRELRGATRVSVDYPTQISAKRKLGENINAADQFNFDGPSEVGISLDFLLHGREIVNTFEFAFLFDDYVGVGDNATGSEDFKVEIGGQEYSGCFIDNYSITVRPFEPVLGTVKFTCYNPPRGESITANAQNSTLTARRVINGHTCSISNGGEVVSANVISEFKYTKTFGRTPVYKLGDENASSFLIDSAVADVSISSTGLAELIDYSGKEVVNDMVLTLENSDGDGAILSPDVLGFTVPSGSRVVSESYNVQGGDTVVTNAQIQNVIL